MRKLRWWESCGVVGAVTITAGFLACGGASEPSWYDKCKAAGGDTSSGTCVKPGFRCDGEEGTDAGYGRNNVWYICQGDPPRWVKEVPQPKS